MTRRKLSLLFALMRPNAACFLGAVLTTAVVVLVGYMTPLVLAETIDAIIGSRPLNAPAFVVTLFESLGGRTYFVGHMWLVALLLVALALVNALCMFLKGRLSALASENIARKIRNEAYDHLQRLSYDYHVKAETGDLIQRCTSDVETLRRFLAVQLMEIGNAALMIGLAIAILLGRNVPLTLASLAMVPVLFISAYLYGKKITADFLVVDESEGKLSATLQENLTGVRVVRAFGRQQHEVEKFDEASVDFRDKSARLYKFLAAFWSSGDALSMAQTAVTLIVGIGMAARGEITVGTLTVFVSYVGMLLGPVRQLGRLLADGGKALVSLQRIDEIMRQPVETDAPDSVQPSLAGDIVFDNVCFGYDDKRMVLNHLSCTIRQGATVAILGGTGSGKSTLVHLLQRLYEPRSGSITIGGVPLNKINKKWLRQRVGLVLQEPFLYAKTLRENVAIVAPDAPEPSVVAAATVARADAFIRQSDRGYDTLVGERGVTLSGGQKQRVAIARTLMKQSDILIFDDSLSAVDTQTDAAIRTALRESRGHTTTLIISHRITTLSEADWILVLDHGHLAQQGTHAQLVAQSGLYQHIHNIQNTLEDELTQTLRDDPALREVTPHAGT